MLFPGALGAEVVLAGDRRRISRDHLGTRYSLPVGRVTWCSGDSSTASWEPIVAIGVDEIQYAKGHKAIRTLVYQIEQQCTRLLWIRARSGRWKAFRPVLHPDRRGVGWTKRVCLLGHVAALPAGDPRCGAAVERSISSTGSILWPRCKRRAGTMCVRPRPASKAGSGRLRTGTRSWKKTRWCVLKRKANLDRTSTLPLCAICCVTTSRIRPGGSICSRRTSSNSGSNESPSWAGKFLDEWCRQVMRRRRIEPMKKIARTLRSHRELILNYFLLPGRRSPAASSQELLNNKAKLTMRKILDGFRTFHVTENRVVSCTWQAVVEPDVAHRFFDEALFSADHYRVHIRRAPPPALPGYRSVLA